MDRRGLSGARLWARVEALLTALLLLWAALPEVVSVELYKCESFLPRKIRRPPYVLPATEPISAAIIVYPQSIFMDHRGLFYYSEKEPTNRLRVVNFTSGNVSTISTGAYPLQSPAQLWVDSTGQLFAADKYRRVVLQVSSFQKSTTTAIAGSDPILRSDGKDVYQVPAKNSWLNSINGICGDTAGNIFVVDNSKVRMIDSRRELVTVVAGDLRYGPRPLDTSPSINDIPAVNMTMFGPTACVVDSAGNVYFSESASRIRRINRLTGRAELVAGTGGLGFDGDHGPATAANLGLPTAMWIDSSAYLYVATKYDLHRGTGSKPTALRRIELFGERRIITLAGYGYNSSRGYDRIMIGGERPFFQSVTSITGDRHGSVYMATPQGVYVCRNSTMPTQSPTSLPTPLPTSSPHGSLRGPLNTQPPSLAPTPLPLRSVDQSNAYAALAFGYNPNVLPVFRDGNPLDRVRTSSLSACFVDVNGDLYYAEHQLVKKVVRASNTVVTVSRPVLMRTVAALWMDTTGTLYIADRGVNVVWKTQVRDTNTTLVAYAGKPPPKPTGLPLPAAPRTSLDPHGIGDHGPATLAKLYQPRGLCGDTVGRLYIVDTDHHRIRAVSLSVAAMASTPFASSSSSSSSSSVEAVIMTIAGNGVKGFSGDGGPASLASFSFPYACVVDDRSGVIYVADQGNARIRQLVPSPSSGAPSPPSPSQDGLRNIPAVVATLSYTVDTFLGTGDTFLSHMKTESRNESAIGRPIALWIDPWGHLFFVTMFAMTSVQRWPLRPTASNPAPFEEREILISSPFKDMVRLLKYNVHSSTLEIVAGGGQKAMVRSDPPLVLPARDISIHSGFGLCGDTSGALYLPFEHASRLVVKIFDGRGQPPASLGVDWPYGPSAPPSPRGETSTPSRAPIGRLRGIAPFPGFSPPPPPPSSSLSLNSTFPDPPVARAPSPPSYLRSASLVSSGNLSASSVAVSAQSPRGNRPSGPVGEASLALRTRREESLEASPPASPSPPSPPSPRNFRAQVEVGTGEDSHGSWTAWYVAAGFFSGLLVGLLWNKRSVRNECSESDSSKSKDS